MATGVRGSIRDGRHKVAAEEAADPEAGDVLLVVNLGTDRLNEALKKIEDGLLACVDAACAAKNDAALIRLHVHLSKIGQRPRGKHGGARAARAAVLTRKEQQGLVDRFSKGDGDEPGP